MPHSCCQLDLTKLKSDLKETAASIRKLKDDCREAKLMKVDDPERSAIFYKSRSKISDLKEIATVLCVIRARHRKREHVNMDKWTQYRREYLARLIAKKMAEYLPAPTTADAKPEAATTPEPKPGILATAIAALRHIAPHGKGA